MCKVADTVPNTPLAAEILNLLLLLAAVVVGMGTGARLSDRKMRIEETKAKQESDNAWAKG